MKKASLTAAFVASLSFGSMPAMAAEDAPLEEARFAEQRLLGSADEEARYLAYQPFTREISARVVVASHRGDPKGKQDPSASLEPAAACLAGCRPSDRARNVVLFIGDAGGIPTLHAASVYRYDRPWPAGVRC